MTLRIIDIETTGQDPATARIIEIASVDLNPDGSICNLQEDLVNPGVPIPPETSAVHHLIDADVADAPCLADVLPKYVGADFYIAHNASFEKSFLDEGLRKPSWLCTYKMALRLVPDAPAHSNQALRYLFGQVHPCGIDRHAVSPHRALSDCIVTAAIFAHLYGLHSGNYQELLAWSAEPALLRTITFGKHFGTAFKDAPADYLKWMTEQADMREDRKFSASYWLKQRQPA